MQKLDIADLLGSINNNKAEDNHVETGKASKAIEQFLTEKRMKVKKIRKKD